MQCKIIAKAPATTGGMASGWHVYFKGSTGHFKEIRSIFEMACQVSIQVWLRTSQGTLHLSKKEHWNSSLGPCTLAMRKPLPWWQLNPFLIAGTHSASPLSSGLLEGGRHKDIFTPADGASITRSNNNLLKEYTCNTQRFFNSPLVSLSRLYNQNVQKLQ